ncbi:hypothetical protein ACIQAC_02255 [Streptomyces sp. NPDC088387]|uniref:hypothetical protein n=1 Tax=Streptomyces sp. NPDC088387 TaxID=3365859 RepID=UPI00381BAE7B
MIRLISTARLEQLTADAAAAREDARQAGVSAGVAFGEHVRALFAVTGRAERAEAAMSEVGVLLSAAVKELSAAQQELLLKDLEIRRLRQESERWPLEGDTLTVLLHHGEPHAVYACRADAHADTATHGFPADHVWKPCDERPAAAFTWRCEAFIYDPASNGFHRSHPSVPGELGGAA